MLLVGILMPAKFCTFHAYSSGFEWGSMVLFVAVFQMNDKIAILTFKSAS